MSHQLTVVLPSDAIPDVDAINIELSRLNLPCQLSPTASLASSPGAFSATLTTSSSTCAIQFEDSDWLSEIPDLRQRAGDRDRCIDFLLGSDMEECALVSAVAAALASLCNAIVYYQSDDLYYTKEEIIAEAESAIRSLKQNDYLTLKPTKYAKQPEIAVATYTPGWIKCPSCSRRFALKDQHVWDGKRHLSCGQRIAPTGQLEELPPKRRWQFWK